MWIRAGTESKLGPSDRQTEKEIDTSLVRMKKAKNVTPVLFLGRLFSFLYGTLTHSLTHSLTHHSITHARTNTYTDLSQEDCGREGEITANSHTLAQFLPHIHTHLYTHARTHTMCVCPCVCPCVCEFVYEFVFLQKT